MFNMDESNKFSFFFSEKGPVIIINLIGPICKVNSAEVEECIRRCKGLHSEWVIVNFRDVTNVVEKNFTIPAIARFQKTIREGKSKLIISGLHPEIKAVLKEVGCLREEELKNNLTEALQSLMVKNKAAA